MERHGPCCPALSGLVARRVAGFTCDACLGISFSYQLDAFGDFIIERKQIFEFRFALMPTRGSIDAGAEPINVTRGIFRVDGSTVSQFAVQHYSGLMAGFPNKHQLLAW
jgi:hypothetical protein